jgi:hypothetical protein
MIAFSTTPLNRALWAGFGYLFIFLVSAWHPEGPVEALAIATISGVLVIQLLRHAVAGIKYPSKKALHPVQSGKPRWPGRGHDRLARQYHS